MFKAHGPDPTITFVFNDLELTNEFTDPYTEQLEISGHSDDLYNGVYYRMEDWDGYAHLAKVDRTAHLYYYAGVDWNLDDRE